MGGMIGKETHELHKIITRERIVQFSNYEPFDDLSKIHTEIDAAKNFGLPDIIAEGIMLLAYFSEMLTNYLGEGWVEGGKLSVNFVKMVLPGDSLTIKSIIKEEAAEGPHRRLALEVWCENQNGEKVAAGTASGLLKV